MPETSPNIDKILQFILTGALFIWMFWAAFKRRRRHRGPVDDGPLDEQYKIYTAEFDVDLPASEVRARLLALSLDNMRAHFQLSKELWLAQIASAKTRYEEMRSWQRPQAIELGNTAILVLVDQSGSLKGKPMAWTVAGLRRVADDLGDAGAKVAIAGFSTAGWHGGFARQKWLDAKRPKRPGRLCALLHISYKDFDEPEWADESWQTMLDPNILRENVDGEAILWAEKDLLTREEQCKILIVVSDGAPVDDSTLMENGEAYLIRHLRTVIARIEAEGQIRLGAIGLNYDVSAYYRQSRSVDYDQDVAYHTLELIGEMQDLR